MLSGQIGRSGGGSYHIAPSTRHLDLSWQAKPAPNQVDRFFKPTIGRDILAAEPMEELMAASLPPAAGAGLEELRRRGYVLVKRPTVSFEGLHFAHPEGRYRFPEELHPDPDAARRPHPSAQGLLKKLTIASSDKMKYIGAHVSAAGGVHYELVRLDPFGSGPFSSRVRWRGQHV